MSESKIKSTARNSSVGADEGSRIIKLKIL